METFRFIGSSWEMELSPDFFWYRSLAACRKAIKYALEDPGVNRYDLQKLQSLLKRWTEEKNTPGVTEGKYCKFIKLLEFMEGKI